MPFRVLADADVADRRRYQTSFGAFQRTQHDLDRKFGSVLALTDQLDPGTDLLRQRVRRGSEAIREQALRKTVRNNIRYLLPQKFVAAISELLLRLKVQQDDLLTLVDHHHRLGTHLAQLAISGLHPAQMSFRLLAQVHRRPEFVAAAFAPCEFL